MQLAFNIPECLLDMQVMWTVSTLYWRSMSMVELHMPFLRSRPMSQALLILWTRPPLCNPTCQGLGSECFMVENRAQCYSRNISAPCGVIYKSVAFIVCRRYLSFLCPVLLCRVHGASASRGRRQTMRHLGVFFSFPFGGALFAPKGMSSAHVFQMH